jgi:hypothetical protein
MCQLRQPWQVLTNEDSWHAGADGFELAADFDRLFGLGVKGVEVAHPAVEEDEYARVRTRRPFWTAEGAQTKKVAEGDAGGEQTRAEELTASGGWEHLQSFSDRRVYDPRKSPKGSAVHFIFLPCGSISPAVRVA